MLVVLVFAILAVVALMQRSLGPTRAGEPHALDIGLFFAYIVAAYGALPVIGIALAGQGIGALHDARFGGEVPSQEAVTSVGLMYLLFLGGFALCYVTVRKRLSDHETPQASMRPLLGDVWVAVALLLAVKLGVLASRMALGIEQGEDYLATYTELADQPLILQQVIGILSATELSASILLIVVVIARNPRLHGFVGVLVALQIALAIAGGGSRTQAFACALAYVVARSIFDRRMGFSFVVGAGGAGLLAFLVAGLLRQAKVADEDLPGLYLLQGGEFLSVFYNSLDLADRLRDFDEPLLRTGLYLVDLLRLAPRQIVGELKLDPAVYYTATFYPEFSEAGGGLAFGAIAESTIGFGALEALVRGSLIGCLYAWIHRACLGPHRTVVRAFVYTWFVALCYQAIRDTTFSVFPRFVFQMMPILVVLWVLGALRPRRTPGPPIDRAASAPT